MCRFFKNTASLLFKMRRPSSIGKLIVINPQDYIDNNYLQNIFKMHSNSLFIFTMQTRAQVNTISIAGHNFTAATDAQGQLAGWMSKRPNLSKKLAEVKTIPEIQKKCNQQKTDIFSALFLSIYEEIEQWRKITKYEKNYPLYLQIMPLISVNLDLKRYLTYIEDIQSFEEYYHLFSYIDPKAGRFIPANNCNTATMQSILGLEGARHYMADKYCQDAAREVVTQFILNEEEYLHTLNISNFWQANTPRAETDHLNFLGVPMC